MNIDYNKDIVVLLNTPFQLNQLMKIAKDVHLREANLLIYYHPVFIEKGLLLDYFPTATLIAFPEYKISFKQFRKYPIKQTLKYRKLVKMLKTFLDKSLNSFKTFKDADIIIFNDRDVLCQLLMKESSRFYKNTSIIAVEEGAGYYVTESAKEAIMRYLYLFITPIAFGFNYHFLEQYGTHPKINKVYARFLDKINNKQSNVEYYSIAPTNTSSTRRRLTNSNILIVSSPLAFDGFINYRDEEKLFENLLKVISLKGYSLFIKLHPRDNKEKILKYHNKYEFIVIDGDIVGENLDYFDFKYIINFGSSIVLDMKERGYPDQNIITIETFNIKYIKNIFEGTKIIKAKSLEKDLALYI